MIAFFLFLCFRFSLQSLNFNLFILHFFLSFLLLIFLLCHFPSFSLLQYFSFFLFIFFFLILLKFYSPSFLVYLCIFFPFFQSKIIFSFKRLFLLFYKCIKAYISSIKDIKYIKLLNYSVTPPLTLILPPPSFF